MTCRSRQHRRSLLVLLNLVVPRGLELLQTTCRDALKYGVKLADHIVCDGEVLLRRGTFPIVATF